MNCGCKIVFDCVRHTPGKPVIEYCNLHAAAVEMLEILEDVVNGRLAREEIKMTISKAKGEGEHTKTKCR